jgi:methyl-accepting chemotaxis protein
MGFTGSGTLDFDSKHGTLEYATQEILQTSDVKVLNTLKESNSAFKDVRSTLSSWSGRALRYYDQDTSVHNNILSDLKSLTGVVAGLPGEISSSVSTALVPVKNAQLQLYNQVGAIASEIPKINTSLEAVKTSIQGLSSSLDQINANISNIGSNKPQDIPQVSPIKDFTPDYSDAINDK